MYSIPEYSPRQDKLIFFVDEGVVLGYIKHENRDALVRYIDDNKLCDVLISRLMGYSINMVKPRSFKTLRLKFPHITPDDTLKRVFHTINCESQEGSDTLASLVCAAGDIVSFLIDFDLLDKGDVYEALEIYDEYIDTLGDLLGPIATTLKKGHNYQKVSDNAEKRPQLPKPL
jgi:hypothetical protein